MLYYRVCVVKKIRTIRVHQHNESINKSTTTFDEVQNETHQKTMLSNSEGQVTCCFYYNMSTHKSAENSDFVFF